MSNLTAPMKLTPPNHFWRLIHRQDNQDTIVIQTESRQEVIDFADNRGFERLGSNISLHGWGDPGDPNLRLYAFLLKEEN